jgi:hypothetical protein
MKNLLIVLITITALSASAQGTMPADLRAQRIWKLNNLDTVFQPGHTDADRLTTIRKYIIKKSNSLDDTYKAGDLDTVMVVHREELLSDYSIQLKDDLPKDINHAIVVYDQKWKEKKKFENYVTSSLYKGLTEKLIWLRAAQPNQVAYTVYRFTYYTGANHQTNTDYYFFDYDDTLLGSCTQGQMESMKSVSTKSPLEAYEMICISLKGEIPIN